MYFNTICYEEDIVLILVMRTLFEEGSLVLGYYGVLGDFPHVPSSHLSVTSSLFW